MNIEILRSPRNSGVISRRNYSGRQLRQCRSLSQAILHLERLCSMCRRAFTGMFPAVVLQYTLSMDLESLCLNLGTSVDE